MTKVRYSYPCRVTKFKENLIMNLLLNYRTAQDITVYWITSTCNCIRKEKKVKSHPKQYKLVADSNYELEVNNDDKIVLQKFRSLHEIEMFCSTALLDSAKGFIQTNKKLKNPPK